MPLTVCAAHRTQGGAPAAAAREKMCAARRRRQPGSCALGRSSFFIFPAGVPLAGMCPIVPLPRFLIRRKALGARKCTS